MTETDGARNDTQLDQLEAALDVVDSALAALDGDDLDQAEKLAGSLERSAGQAADVVTADETSNKA